MTIDDIQADLEQLFTALEQASASQRPQEFAYLFGFILRSLEDHGYVRVDRDVPIDDSDRWRRRLEAQARAAQSIFRAIVPNDGFLFAHRRLRPPD